MLLAKPEIQSILQPPIGEKHRTLGFRTGDRGTMTSRTIMLDELDVVIAATTSNALRVDFADAITIHNVAEKGTTATRRLTNQRLGELYGLDPSIALFRTLRHFWEMDSDGRPMLALLCALARDPLLRATSAPTRLCTSDVLKRCIPTPRRPAQSYPLRNTSITGTVTSGFVTGSASVTVSGFRSLDRLVCRSPITE